MTLITLTPEQFQSLSQAEGRVLFADPQGRVIAEVEHFELNPHRLRATTISELIEELSDDDLDEESLKLRLENYVPVAWNRPL